MRRTALVLPTVLLAGLLGACSSGGSDSLPEVSGAYGSKPKVTIADGVKPSKQLDFEVLSEGDGPAVKKGELLVADYLGEVYASGKVFDNSYDRKVPAAFPIGIGGVIKGWDKSLVGVNAGSRVLMVVPPKQGYGKEGNAEAGIKGTDSLVFVVDVIASYPKAGGAAGKATPVTGLAEDLPTVEGELGAVPTVTVPDGTTPPKEPSTTVLATGTGPEVSKGKLAVLHYVAVGWDGKELGSSWEQGPRGVPIAGEQPTPFDGLVGVPAGSRVLLTLPAQTGGDAATESVAVVVDVLGLHGPAKKQKSS